MAAVDGEESLCFLSAADPPSYLSPSAELSRHARAASRGLYSSLLPFCPKPKPPLDELLVGESFDAEQIWAQIDLVSRPVVSMLRREVRRIERDPPRPAPAPKPEVKGEEEKGGDEDEEEEEEEGVENEDEEEEGVEGEYEEEEDEEGSDEDEEEEEGGSDKEDDKVGNGVEDEFFKIKELDKYLKEDEEREFGEIEGNRKRGKVKEKEDDEDEDGDGEDEDGEDGEGMEFEDLVDDENDDLENAKYEDFFGGKGKKGGSKNDTNRKEKSSKKVKFHDEPEEMNLDDEPADSDVDVQENETLSTHERQQLKIQSKIEEMEKENLEPKFWTMQGEVTAAKRPKNSALEVDLDFEHNMRPPPVMTDQETVSLEDLIKKRIVESRFDDVQRATPLPSKPPKELKELDESKSKEGLAEIYEKEYATQTGLAPAPLSFSDEQKKEATSLFKRLCLKLDALSHFHFAPKPVIEDLSIQTNVPALAMEEIAPLAVSDAAMLAPEEIFKGKGDIKEESELTQAERKRRRANKKSKFKAETVKREAKKARQNPAFGHSDEAAGAEDLIHGKLAEHRNFHAC